jgi:5-methylcytosine-specific restriction protein A
MFACSYPLCPNPAVRGFYCEAHRGFLQGGHRRTTYSPRTRNDNRTFRRGRRAFLSAHPICAICQRKAATVLDHVVPHRGDSELFWDQSNWQALCVTCHNRKTGAGQ